MPSNLCRLILVLWVSIGWYRIAGEDIETLHAHLIESEACQELKLCFDYCVKIGEKMQSY